MSEEKSSNVTVEDACVVQETDTHSVEPQNEEPKTNAQELKEYGISTSNAATSEEEEKIIALFKDYRKWRYVVIVLAIVAIAILAVAMGLYKGKVIDEEVQFSVIMSSYIFVAIILFVVFARIRPIKADLKAWNKAVEALDQSPTKANKKRLAEVSDSLEDNRKTRRDRLPQTAEYKRMRRIWYSLILSAVAVMVIAMVVIRLNADAFGVCIALLVLSYVFIMCAIFMETRRMKPAREAWNREQMQKRKDNLKKSFKHK